MSKVISNKPYFLRALHEWCTDNNYAPYLTVLVDNTVRVPMQYVKDGQITLNISSEATNMLQMGNDFIEFSARFSGKMFKIEVPVERVLALYARETGEGMAFPEQPVTQAPAEETPVASTDAPKSPVSKGFLSVVK